MTTTETVIADQFIAKPPAKVWKALTTPDQLASWWAPGDIKPIVGHTFVMDMGQWGEVACEVKEVEEERRLVYTFGDWTLSWKLVPEGLGTRLILEHAGFDLDNPTHRFAFENMGPGWSCAVLPRLALMLGTES